MSSTPSSFGSFADLSAHLDGLGMFHMDFGLGRVRAALRALGLVRPPFRVAHVVGTNGKGSTSRMLAETAMAHGLRAGLYASPHFVSVRERVLVDGRMLSEAAWVRLGNDVLAASGPDGLTYFEFITVLAVLAFARAGVDVAVMEAGLGGRYDACTAMEADVVVFTPMGLDHTAVLGKTLAEIAADKAGALRPGAPAVTAPQAPEARAQLEAAAAELGIDLRLPADVPGPAPEPPHPGMAGPHQVANARLALAAWRLLAAGMGLDTDSDACAAAVARARVPGRLQRVGAGERGPELYLDGAHNPHALRALAAALQSEGIRPSAVVFGCMRDKDMAEMAPMVAALTDGPLVAVGIPGHERAMAVDELERALAGASLARATGASARRRDPQSPAPAASTAPAPVHAAPDMAAALALVADFPGLVLICGSLYLLGEFFALRPECLGMEGPDLDL